MSSPEWGPRPGGPAAPPPEKSSDLSDLVWSLVVAAVLAVNGCLGIFGNDENQPWAALLGAVFLAGAIWFIADPVTSRAEERRRHQRAQQEAERWWVSRPEAVIARSPDPLKAVRAITAKGNGGVFLGISPEEREWRAAEREHAVLVLGPPRAGKTSALIVPAILAASGPVVSTSTKLEVLHATASARSTLGRVWLFDPSGTDTVPAGVLALHWSPIRSARTWDGAREIADAMVGASAAGAGVQNATHWTESAKALLAPLLHAAALSGGTITDVRRWVSRTWLEDAGRILEAADAAAAADDLSAIAGTEHRERSSIFSTARIVLTAYGSDAAAQRSQRQNFDADRFVRSHDTIYVTAPSHLQTILAPLVAGLLEEIRTATYAYARQRADAYVARPHPVLWALDEVANIAPLRKLPGIVSEAGGQDLQVLACFQDLSQARERWGAAADGFLTLFGTKVVFPGIGDKPTLEALSTLAGDWDRPYHALTITEGASTTGGFSSTGSTYTTQREHLLSPAEIANIPPNHALIVQKNHWNLVQTTPYYNHPPWPAVLNAAPSTVISHGGPDELAPQHQPPLLPRKEHAPVDTAAIAPENRSSYNSAATTRPTGRTASTDTYQ